MDRFRTSHQRRATFLGLSLLISISIGCGSDSRSTGTEPAILRTPLLDEADETTLGQAIEYPDGHAEVSSATVRMAPGEETGWHRHDTPMYVQILEGAVTVEYDSGVVKTYSAGDSLIEAVGTYHNGRNEGDVPVVILTVNIGAEGYLNTAARP